MAGTSVAPFFVRTDPPGAQNTKIMQYLDTNGDGSGTKNFGSNYSGTAAEAYILPPAGSAYRIETLRWTIVDGTGMDYNEYGNLNTALANGVLFRKKNPSGVILDLTGGIAITQNLILDLISDVSVRTWGTTDILTAFFNFKTAEGPYLRLDGDNSERLEIYLQDNLSGLSNQLFFVTGYVE